MKRFIKIEKSRNWVGIIQFFVLLCSNGYDRKKVFEFLIAVEMKYFYTNIAEFIYLRNKRPLVYPLLHHLSLFKN